MIKEIENHKIAVNKLNEIKDKAFEFIKNNLRKITEYDVQQFILKEFKNGKEVIVGDKDEPIVAVNKNTSIIHYFPKKESETITQDSLILIDLWGGIKR